MKVCIVVLNYNGEQYIGDCLPSIVEAAQKSKHATRVVVVDNLSTDNSLNLLKKHFPEVEVCVASENRVFCSYNEYVQKIDDEVVLLMNNDIKVEVDFIDPLIEPFLDNSNVFMTTSKVMTFDGTAYESGRNKSCVKYGIFWHSSIFDGYEQKINQSSYTMAAGFGAFDRKKFLEFGGFDDLYLPGRLEDNDICFRAWRRGWVCWYIPQSVMYHVGGKAFHDKFGSKKTLVMGHKNSFLFFWKNIRDFKYWIEHIVFLLPRLLFALLSGKPELAIGFFQAIPFTGRVVEKRKLTKNEPSVRKDFEIFSEVL